MRGLDFEYVWKCGDLAGHQWVRFLRMSKNNKWFVFIDIVTGEKVIVNREMYPSFRWMNNKEECFYTIKLTYYGKASEEFPTSDECEEPEKD